MIDCTEYERLYPVNEQGKLSSEMQREMLEHQKACKFCASFSATDAYYRTRLQTVAIETDAPKLNWFQIKQPHPATSHRKSVSMRSLSFAAGIAVGVVCVSLWVNFDGTLPNQNYAGTANQPAVAPQQQKEIVKQDPKAILADTKVGTSDSMKKPSAADSQRVLHPVPNDFNNGFQTVTSGN
ncbi:MAG: hypothetical protein OEM52_11950 [bacterium]|nr:hypothetical protein [bacterium]